MWESGGHLLLAFQVGDARVHIEQAYGHAVSLDAYRLSPEAVSELLRDSGLAVCAQLLRVPDHTASIRQAYVVARRSVDASLSTTLRAFSFAESTPRRVAPVAFR